MLVRTKCYVMKRKFKATIVADDSFGCLALGKIFEKKL